MFEDLSESDAPLSVCCIFILGRRSNHRLPTSIQACGKYLGQQQRAKDRKVPLSRWLELVVIWWPECTFQKCTVI